MVDGEIFMEVSEIKYLGVISDLRLTLSLNTIHVIKLIAEKVSLFKNRVELYIYSAIIVPDINKCVSILFLIKK